MRPYVLVLSLAGAVGFVAGPVLAADGVLEINQTCATAVNGCFPGDFQNLPVTITSSAGGTSFRLTSDLVVPNENTIGVFIRIDGGSLDLGGFEIRGPVTCSGTPNVCSAVGTGSGVLGNASRIEVFGGSVVGMGKHGVDLFEASVVRNVRAGHNGERGITIGRDSRVSGSVTERNGVFGIHAEDGSTVDASTASNNTFSGISAGYGVRVSRSTAAKNGEAGISVSGEGGAVTDCSATFNTSDGIILASGNRASGNLAWSNGNDGIEALGSGSYLIGNNVRDNAAAGLRIAFPAAYKDNSITSNTGGTVSGGAQVNLGGNFCTDNANAVVVCP